MSNIRRIAAALCLLLALPAGADTLSARLAVIREQQFQQAWPAASVPATGAEAAILEQLAADHPWDAAVLAARLEADLGDDANAAALLAIAAARSGLIGTATTALSRAAQAERVLLADAVIEVAGQRLAAGAAETAIATLAYLPRLDRDRRNRGSLIKARAELALGRPRDAVRTLQAAEYDPLKLIGASAAARLTAGVLQYDLGVALIRSGDVQRGRALLARLGRGDEPSLQALRDRANLSLAGEFLKAGQGATARAIYERVALEGPYSNRALLGMGWAALGPQGDAQAAGLTLDEAGTRSTPKFVLKALQRRRLIDCENYNRRALAPSELCGRARSFDQAPVPERLETLAEEAIAVWQELSTRDDRDPAVREAWGALGHAAARAGLRTEAIAHYEAAVGRFEAALADNQRAIERAAAGLSEWQPDAAGLAPGVALPAETLIRFETAFGVDAAASSPARQQLLAEQAETLWLRMAAGDDDTLTALLDAQQQALGDTVTATLTAEQTQLRRWLASVRAALATLSDPSFVLEPAP